MQDLLKNLLGGGKPPNDITDFVNRYEQGNPADGYSSQEALNRYQQVAPNCSPQLFEESAEAAFARMSPQERAQLVALMRQQAGQQQVNVPDLNGDGVDDRLQDPRALAQMASRMQQQQPGLLEQLLGGGGASSGVANMAGAVMENPAARAALAGIAAMAVKKMIEGNAR
jgi:hypothetical protein